MAFSQHFSSLLATVSYSLNWFEVARLSTKVLTNR